MIGPEFDPLELDVFGEGDAPAPSSGRVADESAFGETVRYFV
jgi:hypothetical protein